MTRDWDKPPPLRGQTFIVAEHGAVEQPGRLWRPKARLPVNDLWPRCLANPIVVGGLALLAWALVTGVPALLWWAL